MDKKSEQMSIENHFLAIQQQVLGDKYTVNHASKIFGPFTKINAIIGPNNTGKSRLLRNIIKTNRTGRILSQTAENKILVNELITWNALTKLHLKEQNLNLIDFTRKIEQFTNDILDRNVDKTQKQYQLNILLKELPILNREGLLPLYHQTARLIQILQQTDHPRLAKANTFYIPSLRTFRNPSNSTEYFTTIVNEDYFGSTKKQTQNPVFSL